MNPLSVPGDTSGRTLVDGGLVLAIDEGTTNTKAFVVEAETGRVLASASRHLGIAFPAPGAVEQDPEEIWARTLDAVADALGQLDPGASGALAAVAISNQRETVVTWDEPSGEARGPALGWQDSRTAAACRALEAHASLVRERTGLELDPMFSAPKMRYLLDQVPSGRDVRVGTIDTFLVRRLTGRLSAEAGNASRTLLLDLARHDWDEELLDLFGIPRSVLAPVSRSDELVGRTLPGLPIPAGVPVHAVLADSHAALFHHGLGQDGHGKATYGTGSSVMVPTAARSAPPGAATTLAWLTHTPTYAREGNIVASGAALAWAAEILTGGDVRALGGLAAGASVRNDVCLVPAFSGLGAPWYDRDATGLVAGITRATSRADLADAAFDAVAQQVADVVAALTADGHATLAVLHADGGATASELLMQRQADLLGHEVHVSPTAEASALGAALLAAQALGHGAAPLTWAADADPAVVVAPRLDDEERERARRRWRDAVARSRGLATPPQA